MAAFQRMLLSLPFPLFWIKELNKRQYLFVQYHESSFSKSRCIPVHLSCWNSKGRFLKNCLFDILSFLFTFPFFSARRKFLYPLLFLFLSLRIGRIIESNCDTIRNGIIPFGVDRFLIGDLFHRAQLFHDYRTIKPKIFQINGVAIDSKMNRKLDPSIGFFLNSIKTIIL